MATGVGPPNANRCRDEENEDPQQEPPPVRPPRVIRQPHRGGYECEFVERPPKAVQSECPICLLVLREPHQVTCCGNSFCATCVKRVQEDKKCCPTCNEPDFNVYSNKGLKRTLNEYRVYCCQRGKGCDWEGELGELDRHLNLQPPPEKLLVGCQFSEVDCTYCVQPFQRRYVQAHQSDDCPKRPYACQHCNKYPATFEEVTQNHWPVCPFFPLSCPNNCELVIQRQEVERHMSRDCPLTVVQCAFHVVGCQIELTRRDMPSHISENLTGHMSLLQVHMMTHPGENMTTYLGLMVGCIQKVVLDNISFHSELHEAQEMAREAHAELQQSRDQLWEKHNEVRATCDETQEVPDELRESQETVAHLVTTVTPHSEMIAKELQEARERIAQLEASGASQQEQNESFQGAIDTCKEANKTFHQQKDDLTERLTASEQKIQALDTQLAVINDEKKQLHHKLEECSAELEQQKQNTTAALDLHNRESNEQLKAAKREIAKQLTASEHRMRTGQKMQQVTLMIIVGLCVCVLAYVCQMQNHELTEKLSSNEQKLQATLETVITECRDENRRLQKSLTEQERKQNESEAQLIYRITASEQKIRTQEATLNQHQKTLEEVTYKGTLPFEFTMTEFQEHENASDKWYSPPFYTHTHGYRLCIKVDANGWVLGNETHVSVFGWLMRGDFDDDLQWPFQGAITIQLLNQLEDNNHHTHTINFAGTTDPKYVNRVTSGERAGSGWGIQTFISHTQLGLKTDRNCQFLKDNQLKFRVSKATNLDPTAHIHRRCLALESFAGAIEPQVCVAPIEFTLSDFERQKKQNDVWYSPAFYTHPQGYRMCLRVYPNGNRNRLGTHVSIYTYIMRGPFDSGLKWPFRGNVTIQIVNQAGEDNHREMVIPYSDDVPDRVAGRVTVKERSDGIGVDMFLPHSSLGYNAARNTQYLQGDSLRIRISKVKLKN